MTENVQKEMKGGLQTEYVRSLNRNYERILLDRKPEENRYQYRILSRGGIKGLLSCSLRYINGVAYLYYDISSRQNVMQLYGNRCVNRTWVTDFFWSMRRVRQEMDRFLLDGRNILWRPDQIFQDLDGNVFSFMYVPYYEGDTGFVKMMEFLIDRIDYEDETLVECVYGMYERLECCGEAYLQEQIYEDAKRLEEPAEKEKMTAAEISAAPEETSHAADDEIKRPKPEPIEPGRTTPKHGFFSLFDGKRKRDRQQREDYRQTMQEIMAGRAVAEESQFEEEQYGRTVYVEEKEEPAERVHRLLGRDGRLLTTLEKPVFVIGKKREEADLVLDDASVSRIHARIIREKGEAYLEDLNSTNGTFKNGLRMQPYEKRKLDEGDEIKCGTVVLTFR